MSPPKKFVFTVGVSRKKTFFLTGDLPFVAHMVVNIEVDKIADRVANIVVDMEVDKVADMVVQLSS